MRLGNAVTKIGILEDSRKIKEGTRIIEFAFEKIDTSSWKPTSPNSTENWIIAWNGQNKGNIQTKLEGGLYVLKTPSAFESFQDYLEFSGWLYPEKLRRPLVVVHDGNHKDPENWKKVKPSPEKKSLITKEFKKDFPHYSLCKEEKVLKRVWNYPEKLIKLGTSYENKNGNGLYLVSLAHYECGLAEGPVLSHLYFYNSKNNSIKKIDLELRLVDAGDYDNDGNSELLFQNTKYNTHGYKLFSSELTLLSEKSWSYH